MQRDGLFDVPISQEAIERFREKRPNSQPQNAALQQLRSGPLALSLAFKTLRVSADTIPVRIEKRIEKMRKAKFNNWFCFWF